MKKLICILCLSLVFCISGCNKDTEEEVTVEIKTNDVYKEPSDPTNYQAELYNALTEAVEEDKTSEDTAIAVAECFSADFFTLKNKDDASDIGGLTYIPKASRSDFKEYASYTYAQIESITQEYGAKNLPVVKEVTYDEENAPAEANTATYKDNEYDGYSIQLTIAYNDTKVDEEDLKTEVTIQVINYKGRLCIISME